MSTAISSEKFNTLNNLYANAGDWIDVEVKFYGRFDYTSNEFAKVTYNNTAGNFTLTLPITDTWMTYGFSVGDSIDISTVWEYIDAGTPYTADQDWTRNITYIDGNVMHIDAALIAVGGGGTPPPGEIINDRSFPTIDPDNGFTKLVIINTAAAQDIEYTFNLSPNGTVALESVIDGNQMIFSNNNIGTMSITDTIPLVQQGVKSGGYMKDVELTYDSIVDNYRSYTITFKLLQWGFVQDGFDEPSYYDSTSQLTPTSNIKLYGEIGNPTTAQEVTTQRRLGNTGGYGENYNGGVNNYSLVSMDWLDHLGNPIDAMDYKNPSTFTAVVLAPSQSAGSSTYRIGNVFRPTDSTIYSDLPNSIANNLLLNAPEVDYMHSVSPDVTVQPGFVNDDGARLDISDIQFVILGGQVTVTGKITPNTEAKTYFDGFAEGTKKMTLWISIGNFNLVGTAADRVNLPLFNQDIEAAPVLGVQIPDIESSIMLDHGGLDAVGSVLDSQITTEDDVLYMSTFKLIDNVNYEGVRTIISAFKPSTGEEFTLEEFFFNFANVPNIAGQFQPNLSFSRGFNLPPSTDRNVVELVRNEALDEPGKYGLTLKYGFLSRWETWIGQGGVSLDFLAYLQDNAGFNKDWQHYSEDSDWIIRLGVFTVVDGVEDFNYHTFEIRPYEDEDVTPNVTLKLLSDNSNPTNFVDDELHEVTTILTSNVGDYANEWAEATIEDYRSGNRWVISSVLDHGGDSNNPLQPIDGNTKLNLTVVDNVATLKFVVDTNKVNANNISLSYRLRSDDPVEGKILTDGTQKITTDSTNKTIA